MRTSDAGEVWVARAGEIIGGLSLTPVPDGQWLTGLLVAPDWRGKGVARLLIDHACGAERTLGCSATRTCKASTSVSASW